MHSTAGVIPSESPRRLLRAAHGSLDGYLFVLQRAKHDLALVCEAYRKADRVLTCESVNNFRSGYFPVVWAVHVYTYLVERLLKSSACAVGITLVICLSLVGTWAVSRPHLR